MKAVKTHVLPRRYLCFGLLCGVSVVAALECQLSLFDYFQINDLVPAVRNFTFLSVKGKSELKVNRRFLPASVYNVSCDKLVQGNPNETKKANDLMKIEFRRVYMPEIYPSLTKNCSRYMATRGYIDFTVNKEEKLFPLAFSILVYKHAEQVESLLRAIWRPHNLYCVHIDSKSRTEFKEAIKSIAKCFGNVFIHPQSLPVKWGTFTVLEPELLCMDLLWKHARKWKYFINLTGQEFPLKTNYELTLILKAFNGSNDIEGTYKRADFTRWKGLGDPPHKIKPRKGSVHIAVSRAFVDYLLHNKTALDLLKWVKNTSIPDETYFATLNYNPHLKVPGSYTGQVDDGKFGFAWTRYKIWHNKKLCTGKFVRGICIFSAGDLPRLTSSKFMFANKFNFDYDYLAYDCLESWYHRKVTQERFGYLDFDTAVYHERWIISHHF